MVVDAWQLLAEGPERTEVALLRDDRGTCRVLSTVLEELLTLDSPERTSAREMSNRMRRNYANAYSEVVADQHPISPSSFALVTPLAFWPRFGLMCDSTETGRVPCIHSFPLFFC